jgi:hypothetical protein
MTPEIFKNAVDIIQFGITRSEVAEMGICICCKLAIAARCYSESGLIEYQNSGMCEVCFDERYKIG